jgi:sterol desaturase/sphingolipid hydroxylase (fatty acid hydroxylase superfamily)
LSVAAQRYWDVLLFALTALALLESFYPWRAATRPTLRRWSVNGACLAMTCVVGVILRVTPIAVAAAVAGNHFGLLNSLRMPVLLRVTASVLMLDAARFAQHWTMHRFHALWRLHSVHHSDERVDVTTALRFHPLETAVLQISYIPVVAILAPPVLAVLLVEFATLVQELFTHANVTLPRTWEPLVRRVLITPHTHKVHHSVRGEEQNSNFGILFPFWDHLCRTYRETSLAGEDGLQFGVKELPGAPITLARLLAIPFDVLDVQSRAHPAAER